MAAAVAAAAAASGATVKNSITSGQGYSFDSQFYPHLADQLKMFALFHQQQAKPSPIEIPQLLPFDLSSNPRSNSPLQERHHAQLQMLANMNYLSDLNEIYNSRIGKQNHNSQDDKDDDDEIIVDDNLTCSAPKMRKLWRPI